MIGKLKELLAHPATRGLSMDDPRTTALRRDILQSNRFLWRIYDEWYRSIAAALPTGNGSVLELGSGAGFLRQYIPDLIASEVFSCGGIDLILDARQLPFAEGSLKAIAMVDVLHHIPDARRFMREAQRCLRPGGTMVMIEPWVSSWSKLIYGNMHHEPFNPDSADWGFPSTGPLSGANGALPWIIFERDREKFSAEFPEFQITAVRPFMPFRYLVSGGVSMRQLMPQATFPLWKGLESAFRGGWSMFAFVSVTRR